MAKRAGIIPPGGSIPRGQLKAASERRFAQRHNFDDDAASWKPHVIDKKLPQKRLLPSKKEMLGTFEHLLAQTRQEFADLFDMAQKDGERFDIGFVPYLSLLKKKMADIGSEIGKLQ